MKPKRPENEEPQARLFQIRLETIVDRSHPLVRLGEEIEWERFEARFSEGFGTKGGPHALSVRFVVGLSILKHLENLSDEILLERWVENPYWQHFCGFEYFQHKAPCDRTSITKWRSRLGEEGASMLLQETLRIAMSTKAMLPSAVKEVIVDTTVQEKNISFPRDAKLLHGARKKLIEQAKAEGVPFRQSYVRVSKEQLFKYSRYAHVKQFNRARKALRKLRTYLGRVMRDIRRQPGVTGKPLSERMKALLSLGLRVFEQSMDKKCKNKVYSLHEPEVACIAKGKAHKPYEFGCKTSITTTAQGSWVLGVKSFLGNPYDGSTLKDAIADVEERSETKVQAIFVDKGYRGTKHWPEHASVFVSGRTKLSVRNKKLLKRRQAVEPVIGHMKHDHRLDRNFLKGVEGDAINGLLAAVGFNFRKLWRFLHVFFLLRILPFRTLACTNFSRSSG